MQQLNVQRQIFPTLKIKASLLLLAICQLFSSASLHAHQLDFLYPKADFEHYMNTPLRQKLLDPINNGMNNPRPHDASNWTGCRVGKGVLVGTFRDISACAASACYQRDVTVEELAHFSYDQAKGVIRWIWDGIHATQLPDQQVANLYMHIQMHYGNVKVVEKALRKMGYELRLDGRMRSYEFQHLMEASMKTPFQTYNQIRSCLAEAYAGDNPRFRRAFLKFLDDEFPPRTIFSNPLENTLFSCLRSGVYVLHEAYTNWQDALDEQGLALN